MTLDEIMEKWKSFGVYALTLYYGEDIGCDDFDIQQEDRRVRIIATPVGALGGCRILWYGHLAALRTFDPSSNQPECLPNPPGKRANAEGWFIWGASQESVKNALSFLYRNQP